MRTFESAEVLTLMGFPERLAAARKRRALTQKGLAEATGLSHIQVHRYEGGNAQPTLDAIKRLAVALGVTADDLIFDEDERGPSDELKLQFEAVSRLGPKELHLVRELLDSIITRHDARRLFGGAAGDEASP